MNVLFLVHRIPYPPDKGDKIRSYHLLVYLARRANVDLVTHVDDPRDLRHRQILEEMCRSVDVYPINSMVGKIRALGAVPTGRSLSVAFMARGAAARRTKELLATRSYDAVVGFSSQVAVYLPEELAVPFVMDMVDVDSEKWAELGRRGGLRSIIPAMEARRLLTLERKIGRRAAKVVLTTPNEVALFRSRVGDGDVESIGIGMALPDTVVPAAERDDRLAIFLGTMDYEPNVEAVEFAGREIWPRVREVLPDARFRIVGRNPVARVTALGRLPGIEVTGTVPDVEAPLRQAALALVPLRLARGIQTKVLQALAYGVPVVATRSVLACLEPGAEGGVSAHDSPEALAGEVIKLLRDPEERTLRSKAGLRYVVENHDWSHVDARWDDLLEEVCGFRKDATPGEVEVI